MAVQRTEPPRDALAVDAETGLVAVLRSALRLRRVHRQLEHGDEARPVVIEHEFSVVEVRDGLSQR